MLGPFDSLAKQNGSSLESLVCGYAVSSPVHFPMLIVKAIVTVYSSVFVAFLFAMTFPWTGIMWLGPYPGKGDKQVFYLSIRQWPAGVLSLCFSSGVPFSLYLPKWSPG